tara:strand:- start:524 stop:1141 length:618 start_codon:yes stop_codon:yes gene_type:complete
MQKSTLIVGIILCAILAAANLTNLQLNLVKALGELNSSAQVSELIYEFSVYILIPALYKAFKSKAQMYALLLCWLSCDIYFYVNIPSVLNSIDALSGMINGSSFYIGYATFYLITLTFISLQQNCNVSTALSFGIMFSFQLAMAADFIYAPSETFLSKNYHYILTGIHLLIVSTMVRWEIIARIRANIKYGFLVVRIRIGYYLGS